MKKYYVLLVCVFVVLVFGCNDQKNVVNDQNDSVLEENQLNTELYRDSIFLGFEGSLWDHETIWNNVSIYLPAFQRMKRHLCVKDNQLFWTFKSGAELKISENIYEYVVDIWNRQNEKLKEGKFEVIITDYGVRLIPVEDWPETMQDEIVLPVLRTGAHRSNMNILRSIYQNCTGANLAYEIDLEKSDMPRGSIIGRGRSSRGDWSYWCENACVHIGKVDCVYNGISHPDSDEIGSIVYEKVLNISNLPLITIQNYRYFDE